MAVFAGIWTTWTSTRKLAEGPIAFNSALGTDDPLIAAAKAESKVKEATLNCALTQPFQALPEVTVISTLDFDYLLEPSS